VLSPAECHKEILSQVRKCVGRGNVQSLFIPTDCYKILLFAEAMCSDWSAEYHKKFTPPSREIFAEASPYWCTQILLQRKYVKLTLTDH